MEINPGLYEGMPFEEYVAIPAWNASAIKRLALSPRAARYGLHEPETPAMRAGSLVHMALLEPERFEREVVVAPRFHGGMKDENAVAKGYEGGREAKAAWMHDHQEAQIVDGELRAEVLGIAEAFRGCPPARELIEAGKSEVVVVWDDPIGLRCKARIDCLAETEHGSIVADVKRTSSVRDDSFRREIGRLRMHLQGAFYLRGVLTHFGREYDPLDFGQPDNFVWVAFESRAPHFCRVFQLSDPTREQATIELERMLRVIAWCEREGAWPDYAERVRQMDLPTFYEPYRYPDGYQEID